MSAQPLRVCILTPGALATDPRVVKEAQAIAEAGHRVTVIATRTDVQIDCRDEAVLERSEWRALRLDFRGRGNGWRLRRAGQIGCAGLFRLTRHGGLADCGFSPFARPLRGAARNIPADLYIAHYPAALPAAAFAARRHGGLYAFDAEDFHPGDWPEEPAWDGMRRLLHAIEARHLPGCAWVTAASPGIADAYAAAYGIARPRVVLNVFPRAEAPSRPLPAGTAQPGPSVYWFSQTIGPDRGLECAVAAIGRAQTRPHLYLRGRPAAGFADRLRACAAAAGAADRVHLLPGATPPEMVRLAAVYDVGLAGETGHTQNRRIALTNKQFTYLLGGVPSVMSDVPAHRAFAAESGEAVRLYRADDPDSLAAALDALLGDPSALAAARAAAFRLGQTRFNWDLEKAALTGLLADPGRPPLSPGRP